jgi:solute carrier family 12 (sodium/potassium/chloride transporter), member 2
MQKAATSPAEPVKFGTFGGVFTPNLLTILGVIMFMRTGWVVGNAGLKESLQILCIANLITLLTGLSLSSIATNLKVGGGGAYF